MLFIFLSSFILLFISLNSINLPIHMKGYLHPTINELDTNTGSTFNRIMTDSEVDMIQKIPSIATLSKTKENQLKLQGSNYISIQTQLLPGKFTVGVDFTITFH